MASTSIAELVQTNFKLTTELKQLRNEYYTYRAEKQLEEGEEVKRIKSAYQDLESEVVALRREKIAFYSNVVEYTEDPVVVDVGEGSSIATLLGDQLQAERDRYASLQEKYNELRKELTRSSVAYSEPSTCVGSPYYKTSTFSIERIEIAHIKPQLEEVFKSTPFSRRTVPLDGATAVRLPAEPPVAPRIEPVVERRKKAADQSIQRLSKIARFRQQ